MPDRFSVVLPQAASGGIPEIVLRDAEAKSEVSLAPSRGALVTRFFDGARELLFLDRETFLDTTKNVRGGIPVLFPSPGKLENDAWSREGKHGALKQHGFARNAAWAVKGGGPGDREVGGSGRASRAEVTLVLESSAETLRDYPWPFRVELTFALAGRSLRLEILVVNTGDQTMPYGFGFHPYFRVPLGDKAEAHIDTRATQAWDNVQKRERPLGKIELGGGEVDLHLLDHGSTESALRTPHGDVLVKGSEAYQRWVIWTLPGKEFICLEPWTCPGNALNTGAGLRFIAPGQSDASWIELSSA